MESLALRNERKSEKLVWGLEIFGAHLEMEIDAGHRRRGRKEITESLYALHGTEENKLDERPNVGRVSIREVETVLRLERDAWSFGK